MVAGSCFKCIACLVSDLFVGDLRFEFFRGCVKKTWCVVFVRDGVFLAFSRVL